MDLIATASHGHVSMRAALIDHRRSREARVHEQLAPLGYRVLVEDRLMDVTVERDGHLLWYIEVKEKAAALRLRRTHSCGRGIRT